jgi:predicted nucleotidyltransferase
LAGDSHSPSTNEPRSTTGNLQQQPKRTAEEFGVFAIYAFGSRGKEIALRVQGDSPPRQPTRSDIDIGVQLRPGVHLHIDQKVAITRALEELFEEDCVDLVMCEMAHPFLAQEIVSGELLYCDDLDKQAAYELYVLRRAGDLAPYETERRRMILEEGAK